MIGIASEPKQHVADRPGSSEDLLYAEAPEWTDDLIAEIEREKEALLIDQPENVRMREVSDQEFPTLPDVAQSPDQTQRLSRKERRTLKAKERVSRRRDRSRR